MKEIKQKLITIATTTLIASFCSTSSASLSNGEGALSVTELLTNIHIKPTAGEHWRVNGESNTNDQLCYQNGSLYTYAFDNDQEHAVKITAEKMPQNESSNAKACKDESSIVQLEAIKDGQISKLINVTVPMDTPNHFAASYKVLPTPKPKPTIAISLNDVLQKLNLKNMSNDKWQISFPTNHTSCDFDGVRYNYEFLSSPEKLINVKNTILLGNEKPGDSCFKKMAKMQLTSNNGTTVDMTIQLNPYKKLKSSFVVTSKSSKKTGEVNLD